LPWPSPPKHKLKKQKNITLITPYQQSVTTNEMLNTLSELAGKKRLEGQCHRYQG